MLRRRNRRAPRSARPVWRHNGAIMAPERFRSIRQRHECRPGGMHLHRAEPERRHRSNSRPARIDYHGSIQSDCRHGRHSGADSPQVGAVRRPTRKRQTSRIAAAPAIGRESVAPTQATHRPATGRGGRSARSAPKPACAPFRTGGRRPGRTGNVRYRHRDQIHVTGRNRLNRQPLSQFDAAAVDEARLRCAIRAEDRGLHVGDSVAVWRPDGIPLAVFKLPISMPRPPRPSTR